jgi:septum formation protein
MKLVLASGSAARRTLLANAGLAFTVAPAALDERAAEAPLAAAGAAPADIALALAAAKATAVAASRPHDLIVGADQVLEIDGERLAKPADMEAARRQLLRLSGRSHRLHSAVACARGEGIAWQFAATATMTMRRLEPGSIGRYLAEVGPAALTSVGAYQIEGPGIRLFEAIEGDYFAILGLPMLPLLAYLRSEGLAE